MTAGWPAGRRQAPVTPGAWPHGDEGAPPGAVRCVTCKGGLHDLGEAIDHEQRTGHEGVQFIGGTDRVWSIR